MTTTYRDSCVDGHHGTRHYGKYRGKVTATVDPQKRGRVQVTCPAVLQDGKQAWAMPSSPYAGSGVGLFTVPPVGANVWVEFEAGDINYPIVTGCFWARGESPSPTGAEQVKVLKTGCLTLTIDDAPGAGTVTVQVDSSAGALKIVFDSAGIALTTRGASVRLDAASVSVNGDALKVT